MVKVNLGKNTIGDNKKMQVQLHDYEMSNKDLSFVFRSSMAVGTLTPCLKILCQKGDIIDLSMVNKTLTHPTIGPLFGAYKIQHFIFSCPIRLYNSWLHNNKTGIGNKMNTIVFPKMYIKEKDYAAGTKIWKSSRSSLLNYLGIKGFRFKDDTKGEGVASFQALPVLMYTDIFKNYFANTQEDKFYMITGLKKGSINLNLYQTDGTFVQRFEATETLGTGIKVENGYYFKIENGDRYASIYRNLIFMECRINKSAVKEGSYNEDLANKYGSISTDNTKFTFDNLGSGGLYIKGARTFFETNYTVALTPYNIEDLDTIRERILKCDGNKIMDLTNESKEIETGIGTKLFKDMINETSPKEETMHGLFVKTYDSDVFQNWISNELVEGAQGINEASAVEIVNNKLSIDALNLAYKVYNFLNRIAVSGNTLKSWLETAYTAGNYMERAETPLFEGGMTQYIEFEEVISNAATNEEPLGTLAGRGKSSRQVGDGKLHIKITEPSYLIGIAVITPMIDYSQGNEWDMTNLSNMDDLHKPAFDQIGFQDSMNQERAFWSAEYNTEGKCIDTAAGKSVAWINYTTNFNKTFGSFAAGGTEDFMVMNRNYEGEDVKVITDLTTYIDPSKFNQVFAEQTLNAQNFWVQTAFDIKVRRNISSRLIPNL